MAVVRHYIPGFLAGELSPMLGGRIDTDQYAYGLETCENFVPWNEGPLVKRPGFAFVCDAAATSTWLSAFRRGVTQEYVVEWLEQKWRFFTNGGRIETAPGVAYEVDTPYPAAIAREICAQQSFDRQYLFHGEYAIAAMRRDDAVTFAHEEIELVGGPFTDGNNDRTITVEASATTGAGIALTATAAIFRSGHVGSLFRLEAKDFSDIPAWETQMDGVEIGDLCRSNGKVYQAASAGKTGTAPPAHSEGTEWDGQGLSDVVNEKGPYGVKWTYLHDRFGVVRITAIGGAGPATTATATVIRRLPNSLTTVPSWRWAYSAFSDDAGYPHLGTLYKGRVIAFKDLEIIGTVVGDYGGGRMNFATFSDLGVLADDLAFRRTLSIEEPPLWVARDRRLMLGLPGRELAIGPLNSSAAFSGTNIDAEDQSFYGSELVWPVQFGTETIFVERGGRRLRSADYSYASDRYDADDLTAAAGHICRGGILQLAHQRGPQALVYGVRDDGQLIVHSKSRAEIKGFSRTVLGGGARALSAVSIYGEDGRTEELWLLVQRERGNGATVKEIWKQMPWRQLGDDQAEQFYVDGGVRIEASAGQTVFAGLTHLAGQAVAVLANGAVVSGCAVDHAGTLTLPAERVPAYPFVLIVGLAYTALAVTLRPEIKLNGASSQGMIQRVLKVMTRVLETVGIKVGVPGGPDEEVIFRSTADAMDRPIPLRSDDAGGEVEGEFDRSGRGRWVSDVPTAAIVAAAMLNVDVSPTDV